MTGELLTLAHEFILMLDFNHISYPMAIKFTQCPLMSCLFEERAVRIEYTTEEEKDEEMSS